MWALAPSDDKAVYEAPVRSVPKPRWDSNPGYDRATESGNALTSRARYFAFRIFRFSNLLRVMIYCQVFEALSYEIVHHPFPGSGLGLDPATARWLLQIPPRGINHSKLNWPFYSETWFRVYLNRCGQLSVEVVHGEAVDEARNDPEVSRSGALATRQTYPH